MRPIIAVSGLPKVVLNAGVFTRRHGKQSAVSKGRGEGGKHTQAAHQAVVVADQHEAQRRQRADRQDEALALQRGASHRGGLFGVRRGEI